MTELDLQAALEVLLDGTNTQQGLGRTAYWERALQAADPVNIGNPHPSDSEYRPEAEYFSRLEAIDRLNLASATLVFKVMFGDALIRDSVLEGLATVVGN